MNKKEMKTKVYGLIEELSPESDLLTKDKDIATKFNDVTNQIMYELSRIKKIPKYIEIEVSEGELIDHARLEKECGYQIYQVSTVKGVKCAPKADNTIFKILSPGTAEFELFVYPERITGKTGDSYEFELSSDVLEIMPYGIAADLLMTDVSSNLWRIYRDRYEGMLSRLDTRNTTGMVTIEGGVDI